MSSTAASRAFLDAVGTAPRRQPPAQAPEPPMKGAAPRERRIEDGPGGTIRYTCADCPTILERSPSTRGIWRNRCGPCTATHNGRRRLEPHDVGRLEPPNPDVVDAARRALALLALPGVVSIAGKLGHHIHVGPRHYEGDDLGDAIEAAIEGEGL